MAFAPVAMLLQTRRRRMLFSRDHGHQVLQGLIGFAILFVKLGEDISGMGLVKVIVRRHLTSYKFFAQRTKTNKANSQLFQQRDNHLIGVPAKT